MDADAFLDGGFEDVAGVGGGGDPLASGSDEEPASDAELDLGSEGEGAEEGEEDGAGGGSEEDEDEEEEEEGDALDGGWHPLRCAARREALPSSEPRHAAPARFGWAGAPLGARRKPGRGVGARGRGDNARPPSPLHPPTADPVVADSARLRGSVARHRAQLEALKERDPEFYAYLQVG
jgi:hypothetical protein